MKKTTFSLLAIILMMTFLSQGCAVFQTDHYYRLETMEFADLDYGYDVKTARVRNIDIAYIDEGQGDQVILMIHGLGSNAKGWTKNIPLSKDGYRVIAVDLPGYFKSGKGYWNFSLSFYAQVLVEFLDQLDIDKAVFMGHSMGGQISMVTALNYPDRVDKLVLISPAGFEKFSAGESAWFKRVMKLDFVKKTPVNSIEANLKSNFYNMPDDAEFMITERIQVRKAEGFEEYCYAVVRNVHAMVDEPVWDKLDKIQQPTLILFGENDQLIPNRFLHAGFTSEIAEIGASQIPNNEMHMLPECGHFAQFEKFEMVNDYIRNFLK